MTYRTRAQALYYPTRVLLHLDVINGDQWEHINDRVVGYISRVCLPMRERYRVMCKMAYLMRRLGLISLKHYEYMIWTIELRYYD